MIIDIPTPSEFETAGLDYLDLAWDSTCNLLLSPEHSDIDDGDMLEEYWNLAQRNLPKSLALVHQGVELLIKSKITETSPFLLLSGKSSEWPAKCQRQDTSFCSFKTIDAHEIIKVYNTISSVRLNDKFIAKYENLRKQRNIIIHGIDKNIKIHVKDILIAILELSSALIKPSKWIQMRKEYIESKPEAAFGEDAFAVDILFLEIGKVIEILDPSDVKKHFNFNKKQRRYICWNCKKSCEGETPDLAQLSPNNPNSPIIHCILCGESRNAPANLLQKY